MIQLALFGWVFAFGHAGKLVGGLSAGRRVLALSGRVHHYEGHDLQTVTFAMRAMGRLGVKQVILTNAAGGIHPKCSRGALMVIDDHINLMFCGRVIEGQSGAGRHARPRSHVYDRELAGVAHAAARRQGVVP